jgi:hypothetical protein
MSEHERTGSRNLAYSRWHRTASLRRFIGERAARACGMIDLDGVEICRRCSEPLALVETCYDVQQFKATTVLRRLAMLANLDAYLIYYVTDLDGEITGYRIAKVWPERIGPVPWTVDQWARKLAGLRRAHRCRR